MALVRILRRIGIAIGSVVMAWLAMSVVAGPVLGPGTFGSPVYELAVLAFGALIYRDIVRREPA